MVDKCKLLYCYVVMLFCQFFCFAKIFCFAKDNVLSKPFFKFNVLPKTMFCPSPTELDMQTGLEAVAGALGRKREAPRVDEGKAPAEYLHPYPTPLRL